MFFQKLSVPAFILFVVEVGKCDCNCVSNPVVDPMAPMLPCTSEEEVRAGSRRSEDVVGPTAAAAAAEGE